MQMGPLELADRIGLDRVAWWRWNICFENLASKISSLTSYQKKLVRAKQFGVKTGAGFFTYDPETGKRLHRESE